ncbi:MAG: methylmalonyl-CoA mutase family protein [Deltaproteobacteria bacterium]|nr:methylmalonyl-CoA mutase family protein [Deltaproteobacteria bacterium]
MGDEHDSRQLEQARGAWEAGALREALGRQPERRPRFATLSDIEVRRLYTPADLPEFDCLRDLGFPGEYPFTRGVHATMYRGRLWTMRQFAGFGSPEDTNRRFHYLLRHGETGLSVAFDVPTLMGYDSDHERARGEVGTCGVAVDSLADMERLFAGIRLDRISTSMTINAPAAVVLAMYIAVAEQQGVPPAALRGTTQTDILKEFIAQKEWICPPRPSMRIVTDMLAYCTSELPQWNPISISGYHIREAGSTAVQELAFTLADGIAYVDAATRAGLPVDAFAPRLSFFFNVHNDFFEEIAKFRAARRMWARIMRERFHAETPRAWMLRCHAQTAGCSLTAQQPLVNVIRVALQALAAVLGGCQSLHANALDEALCLPTERAAALALRTQQIIAHESGVADTVDPLGGAYFLEQLTDELEARAWAYLRRIDEMGGMLPAIEAGYPQREIHEAAVRYQREVDRGERIVVGVNAYKVEHEEPIETLRVDPQVEAAQITKLQELRGRRDPQGVKSALEALRGGAAGGTNLMPLILEAVRAYATLGEICDVFREVFGTYQDPADF